MVKIYRTVFLIFLVSSASSSYACRFDTDCNVGSKCVKQSGMNGACVGGLNPGNANDKNPVYNPLDLNRGSSRNGSTGDARSGKMDADGTHGDTCSFDTDCGPGSQCLKGSGIYGTCM